MTEYTVGKGGDFATLTAAAKAVKRGDVVRVLAGVYKETLPLTTPGVSWLGESGAVIDGGWNAKTKTGSWQSQVAFLAPDVTVRGLMIRNCPGRAVGVMASGSTLENCILEVTYRGAILVGDSSGATISGVTIRGNLFQDMSLMRAVGDLGNTGRNVNGSFLIHNCHDSIVEDNVLRRGYGEGIIVGRGSLRVIVRRNEVYSTGHVLIYVNRAEGTQFLDNILFHVPDPTYGGPKGDSMSAAIVIGDEGGPITSKFPASHDTIVRGNLVVNAGGLFQVRNNPHNYNTQLLNTVIENNTFIAGPSTRQGIMIKSNPHGRPHKSSVFRNNVIDFTHAPKGADIGSFGQGDGVTFESNAWGGSVKPPKSMQSPSDVYGDLGIVRADAPRDKGLDIENYRPRPGSPLVAGGRRLGALGVAGSEPPVDPPVDPDPPTDPPVDPEPEPVDWITISLADFEEIRAAVAAAHAMLENMAADTGSSDDDGEE